MTRRTTPKNLPNKAASFGAGLLLSLLLAIAGCTTATIRPNSKDYREPIKRTITATAYCNCGKCCGWHYSWWFQPVYSSGVNRGKPKKVGVTASGTRAKRGTIAADKRYPFGTIFYIPGYGYGRVEDRGGAIKGDMTDLWFPSHKQALNWGRQKVNATIWLPK